MNQKTMSGISPTASLESLGKMSMSLDSTSQQQGAAVPKAANFLNQLEAMMGAVKKEASALEGMKSRLKDMEEVKLKYQELKNKNKEMELENFELTRRIKEHEQANSEIRNDMQRLNDIYTAEHSKHHDLQLNYNKLQQDFTALAHDKDYLSKEMSKLPEMKTSLKALKHQMHNMKLSYEEEKHALIQKLHENEKKYSENSSHINNLIEEISGLKEQVSEKQEQVDRLSSVYVEMKQNEQVVSNRYNMIIEDITARNLKSREVVAGLQATISQQNVEQQNTLFKLQKREEKYSLMKEKLSHAEVSYNEKIIAVQKSFTTMQEQVKEISQKNTSLAQENAQFKSKLYQKTLDEEELQNEISKLRSTILEVEARGNTKELEALSQIRSISSQRDDALYQLQSVQSQFSQLQEHNRDDVEKYRGEVLKSKEHESVLSEEIERLHRELEEKMVTIHILETEKLTQENSVKQEANGNSHMINTLKIELEKRLSELMNMREERDQLSLQQDRLRTNLDELKAGMAKQEHMYKQMLENERKNMTKELNARSSRIQNLEKEKEELLNETQSLCDQISNLQKQTSVQNKQLEEYQKNMTNLQSLQSNRELAISSYLRDIEKLTTEKQELLHTVQLKEQLLQQEKAQKDVEIKEVRKLSSQTLVDMNEQMKNIYDENNNLKKSYYESVEKEKKLNFELNKLVKEYDEYQRKYSTMLQDAQRENMNLKSAVQENFQKQGLYSEHKSKLETDVILLTKQMDRLLEEKQGFQETIYSLEQKQAGLTEQLQSSNHSVQSLQQNIQNLHMKINEYENLIGNKSQAIESLSAELSSLENHGLIEIKKYKINMTHLEHEYGELQSTHQYLQREYEESKNLLQKTINQHNQATQGLLDEMTSLKDALQKEKKSKSMDAEALNSKYQALEMNLMKTKQEYEDILNRKNIETNEMSYKFIYLEQENQKLKSNLQDKESNMSELEQQIHSQKKLNLELKDQVSQLGAENCQIKSTLEIEMQNKKRLESKVKVLLEQQANSVENMSVYSSNNVGAMPSARVKSARAYAGSNNLDGAPSLYSGSNTLPYNQTLIPSNAGPSHQMGLANTFNDDNVSMLSMNTNSRSMYNLNTTNTYMIPEQSQINNNGVPSTPMRPQSFHQLNSNNAAPVPALPIANNNVVQVGSPAVDRVSAALAFKLAQQQRNQPQPQQGSQFTSNNSLGGLSMEQSSNTGRFSRPTTATAAPNNPVQANGYDPYYDDINLDPPVNAYPLSTTHLSNTYEVDRKELERIEQNSVVEESIRRTQEKLNRRLGLQSAHATTALDNGQGSAHGDNVMTSPSNMTLASFHTTSSNHSNGSGTSKNAGKLLDTIQQAHSLYPSSPVKGIDMQHNSMNISKTQTDVDISIPALKPASPPRLTDEEDLNYLGSHPDNEEDEVLMDNEGDDEDLLADYPGAMSANQMEEALNKGMLRFQYPSGNGKTNKPMSAKGKKGKKKKKSTSVADLHGEVQLPKINYSRSSQLHAK